MRDLMAQRNKQVGKSRHFSMRSALAVLFIRMGVWNATFFAALAIGIMMEVSILLSFLDGPGRRICFRQS